MPSLPSPLLRALLPLMLVAAAPAASAALYTQTIVFDTIATGASTTQATFTAAGWNLPFPVGQMDTVGRLYFEFTSSDPVYMSHVGPNGGVPQVEVGYVDDGAERTALGSVGYYNEYSLTYGMEAPSSYLEMKSLLQDGTLTMSLHGFENIPADPADPSTSQGEYDFAYTAPSTLTLYFRTDAVGVPDLPGTPSTNEVPAPGTLALVLPGLAALAWRRRPGRTDA